MTPDRMRAAAEALRFNAEILRDCHTVRGDWPSPLIEEGDRIAKGEHDLWMALAGELDAKAAEEEEIERMVREGDRPRTPEDNRRSGEMFARLSARLIQEAEAGGA